MKILLSCCLFLFICLCSNAENNNLLFYREPATKENKIQKPSHQKHFIKKVGRKSARLNRQVQRAKRKYLHEISKEEKRMQQKLCRTNAALADYIFKFPLETNLNLKGKLKGNSVKTGEFFSEMDKMEVAVKYFEQADANRNTKKAKLIKKARANIDGAKRTLNEISGIQQYLRSRKKQLNASLEKYPELSDELLAYDKSTYYFTEQVNEYKNLFKEPSNIEEKVFDELKRNNEFGSFKLKNGELANVFGKIMSSKQEAGGGQLAIIGIEGATEKINSANGMQTIKETEELMQHSLKELGSDAKEIVEQNMGKMQNKIKKLKTDFPNLSNVADIPNFKPNPLKTKRFADRVKYGLNLQFTPGTLFVPVAGEIGFNTGYQFTMKATAGITTFYRAGFGDGLRRFEWSQQGWSYGAYAEQQLKRMFYLYGTWERDYYADVSYRNESLNKSTWKNSAMLGLKIKLETKKKHVYCMTLLYDFMHETTVPFTPALVYRMGWEF